jgi:uncharacterized protein YbjQ (UPF0145 family)
MQQIHISRVVTRNFVIDFVAQVQNLLGRRMSGYEKMIDNGTTDIWKEVHGRKLKMKWYHFQMTQLNNDAIALLFYGEAE